MNGRKELWNGSSLVAERSSGRGPRRNPARRDGQATGQGLCRRADGQAGELGALRLALAHDLRAGLLRGGDDAHCR